MERLTEFPALEARKTDLERQAYEATRQVNDGVFTGKLDVAVEMWLQRVNREIVELRYVLRLLGSRGKGKIAVDGKMMLLGLAVIVAVLVAQVAILAAIGH